MHGLLSRPPGALASNTNNARLSARSSRRSHDKNTQAILSNQLGEIRTAWFLIGFSPYQVYCRQHPTHPSHTLLVNFKAKSIASRLIKINSRSAPSTAKHSSSRSLCTDTDAAPIHPFRTHKQLWRTCAPPWRCPPPPARRAAPSRPPVPARSARRASAGGARSPRSQGRNQGDQWSGKLPETGTPTKHLYQPEGACDAARRERQPRKVATNDAAPGGACAGGRAAYLLELGRRGGRQLSGPSPHASCGAHTNGTARSSHARIQLSERALSHEGALGVLFPFRAQCVYSLSASSAHTNQLPK